MNNHVNGNKNQNNRLNQNDSGSENKNQNDGGNLNKKNQNNHLSDGEKNWWKKFGKNTPSCEGTPWEG